MGGTAGIHARYRNMKQTDSQQDKCKNQRKKKGTAKSSAVSHSTCDNGQ